MVHGATPAAIVHAHDGALLPAFIAAEVVGGALAWAAVKALYPGVTPAEAAEVVVTHHLLDGAQAPAQPPSHQRTSPVR